MYTWDAPEAWRERFSSLIEGCLLSLAIFILSNDSLLGSFVWKYEPYQYFLIPIVWVMLMEPWVGIGTKGEAR